MTVPFVVGSGQLRCGDFDLRQLLLSCTDSYRSSAEVVVLSVSSQFRKTACFCSSFNSTQLDNPGARITKIQELKGERHGERYDR